MQTATATTEQQGAQAAIGELLYRFEADVTVTPIGLVSDGIRMTVDFDGEVVAGILEGARVWGTDPFVLRSDGVGVIDAPKTISDGERSIYEAVYAYLKAPEGLEIPPAEVILDPGFEWPDVPFPLHGFSTFRAADPELSHLSGTIAALEGMANFATGRLAVETRPFRHTLSVAPARG